MSTHDREQTEASRVALLVYRVEGRFPWRVLLPMLVGDRPQARSVNVPEPVELGFTLPPLSSPKRLSTKTHLVRIDGVYNAKAHSLAEIGCHYQMAEDDEMRRAPEAVGAHRDAVAWMVSGAVPVLTRVYPVDPFRGSFLRVVPRKPPSRRAAKRARVAAGLLERIESRAHRRSGRALEITSVDHENGVITVGRPRKARFWDDFADAVAFAWGGKGE